MRPVLLLMVPLMLGGCFLFGKKESKYPWRHQEVTTSEGYRVAWLDSGTTSKDGPWKVERAKIDEWFHQAVDRACRNLANKYVGPTYAEWIHHAKGHRWVLVDNCCFVAADGIQWAAGEHVPSKWGHWIRAGLYLRRPNAMDGAPASEIPATSPPWTQRENPARKGEWRWGELRAPFPAFDHELGHHVWGSKFEHGWTPPKR